MRGEAELTCAWAGAYNQNIETVRFRVGLRRDCVKLVCDVVCTSVSRNQSETIMYFTKADSITSKADILLLVKLFSCN